MFNVRLAVTNCMGNYCSPGCRWILDLTESGSEGFPTYFCFVSISHIM